MESFSETFELYLCYLVSEHSCSEIITDIMILPDWSSWNEYFVWSRLWCSLHIRFPNHYHTEHLRICNNNMSKNVKQMISKESLLLQQICSKKATNRSPKRQISNMTMLASDLSKHWCFFRFFSLWIHSPYFSEVVNACVLQHWRHYKTIAHYDEPVQSCRVGHTG